MPNEFKFCTVQSGCESCEFRRWLAKTVDMHIDWRDCWVEDCEHRKKKEGADNV